jgi:hypothetical protein
MSTERSMPVEDATVKFGLLMESAQAHQKLAETQLEGLRVHTRDLDGVVRDEIRRTLIDELKALTAETTRAAQALRSIRRVGAWRGAAWTLGVALLCALIPVGVARWALPSPAELAGLRLKRDEMNASLQRLQQLGGSVEWRRCGEAGRLCVRVDRKAPTYGDKADYFVVEGY